MQGRRLSKVPSTTIWFVKKSTWQIIVQCNEQGFLVYGKFCEKPVDVRQHAELIEGKDKHWGPGQVRWLNKQLCVSAQYPSMGQVRWLNCIDMGMNAHSNAFDIQGANIHAPNQDIRIRVHIWIFFMQTFVNANASNVECIRILYSNIFESIASQACQSKLG